MSFKEVQNNIKRKLNQLDKTGQDFFGGVEDSIEKTYDQVEQFGEDLYQSAENIFMGEDTEGGATVDTTSETVSGASESDARRAGGKNKSAKIKSAKPGPLKEKTESTGYNLVPGETPPPWPNELEPYTSFSTIISLGVLSPEELNNPDETYISKGIKDDFMILRSGGGLGDSKTTTEFEKSGRVEYYIDDLDIESFIAPNNQTGIANGVSLSFNVIEPYSLGLFLQTTMIAAKKAGYENYIDAPFLLQIDFKGWDEDNNSYIAPYSTRKIPIKFRNVIVESDESGSRYQCYGYVHNETALLDEIQTIKNDISLQGEKLVDLLLKGEGSLSAIINNDYVDQEASNLKASADRVVISFPTKDSSKNPSFSSIQGEGATVDYGKEQEESFERLNYDSNLAQRIASRAFTQVNKIGNSKVIGLWTISGELPYAVPGGPDGTYDDIKKVFNRTKKGLHPTRDARTYRFYSGTKIEHIIQQLVLISEYGKELVEMLKYPDTKGRVHWFRIETNVYVNRDPEQMRRTGRYPRVYVYKVVPYKASIMRFKTPNQETPNLEALKGEVAKEYNYIYTGENKDIIDFKLEYNYAFFTALNDDQENLSSTTRTGAQTKVKDETSIRLAEDPGKDKTPVEGAPMVEGVKENSTQKVSGSDFESVESRVARDFHNAFLNSNVDLIKLDLTIMGDPFFIPNSGLGNYNSAGTSFDNMKSDGSIEYQGSEVNVNLVFRTPFDYNQKGTVDYPKLLDDQNTEIVQAFSGLYQVIKVRHSIAQNLFTQTLELVRLRHQEDSINETNVGPLKEVVSYNAGQQVFKPFDETSGQQQNFDF